MAPARTAARTAGAWREASWLDVLLTALGVAAACAAAVAFVPGLLPTLTGALALLGDALPDASALRAPDAASGLQLNLVTITVLVLAAVALLDAALDALRPRRTPTVA
jgi:hypothetical protein